MSALVAVLLLVPMADAKEKELSAEAKKELTKLEGKWIATKVLAEGNEETPPEDQKVIEFKGRKFLFGDKELFEVAALDPSTDPKCLDLKAVMDLGELSKGTVYEAIYKIDGDTLLLAVHTQGGNHRPAKFESEKDSKVVLVTFKREKK